jgi:tetratricopeptide (TPR) repeat protein
MKFSKYIAVGLLLSSTSFAGYQEASKSLGNSRRMISEMVKDGYYFSVIPWMKDYIVKNPSLEGDTEDALDRVLAHSGVKIFESLPESYLRRSRSGNIRYILAKRLMKKGQNNEALDELNKIKSNHPAYPFATHMKGVIYASQGQFQKATNDFNDCIDSSKSMSSDSDLVTQKNQFLTNRDFCVAGLARVQFAQKEYKKADLAYLDIPKDSFVWPEILFEEAWNSYYGKNYNRTLGKLISYKAPVFDFVFKPETEVLKALAYTKMCLFDDAKKTVDAFYDELLNPSRELRSMINANGKNYRHFYNLMADHDSQKRTQSYLVDNVLRSIKKEAAFIEMKTALSSAIGEYNRVKGQPSSQLRSMALKNMQTVLEEYRTIIGAYVRAGMVSKYAEVYTAFQNMSYIKLEVLSLRKEKLYQSEAPTQNGKRGDVKYIERNDKQYFWTFNGEFWADELGDYVFALRSEC